MHLTKEELFESALALNGDDKRYIITVENNKIITRVKWMDATLFSPRSISREMKAFEYIVKVNDNGTYTEITKTLSSGTSLSSGGISLSKGGLYGGNTYSKTIAFGKNNQTGELGMVNISFNSKEYKHPVKELMKSSGFKKKASPVAISAIIVSAFAVLFALTAAILVNI